MIGQNTDKTRAARVDPKKTNDHEKELDSFAQKARGLSAWRSSRRSSSPIQGDRRPPLLHRMMTILWPLWICLHSCTHRARERGRRMGIEGEACGCDRKPLPFCLNKMAREFIYAATVVILEEWSRGNAEGAYSVLRLQYPYRESQHLCIRDKQTILTKTAIEVGFLWQCLVQQ